MLFYHQLIGSFNIPTTAIAHPYIDQLTVYPRTCKLVIRVRDPVFFRSKEGELVLACNFIHIV